MINAYSPILGCLHQVLAMPFEMVISRSDHTQLLIGKTSMRKGWGYIDGGSKYLDSKLYTEHVWQFYKYVISPLYPELYKGILLADGSCFSDERSSHKFVLQTEDPKRLPLPSPFLFKTHYKFANALHHFYVEEHISAGWPCLESRCELTIFRRKLHY